MTGVLIITIATCTVLIASVLLKPNIEIKSHTLGLYWIIALAGALMLIGFGFISPVNVLKGLTADSSINPLKILVLFLSMSTLSIFLDKIGFFKYLANYALTKAGTNQKTLFVYLYLLVAVLTVFTSNDIIILTFTPFICYFAKNAKINPIPYLFAEFTAANTWSMMLIIGNPTNVYLATANEITFMPYVSVMWLPTLLCGLLSFFVLSAVFGRMLKKPLEASPEDIRIADKRLLLIGLIHLSACTVLLVISSYIGLEMWLITLCFALSLFITVFIYQKVKAHCDSVSGIISAADSSGILRRCLKRAPWELVPFVISMFVIVLTLEQYNVTGMAAALLGGNNTILAYGVSSFLCANLINNIPMSVFFSSILQHLSGLPKLMGVYAAIIGSNLGAIFTPVGALAGIMWSNILKKHNVKFSFVTYVKYGFIISVPSLFAALAGLWLRSHFS